MRGASKTFIKDFSNLLNKVFLPALTRKPVNNLGYDDILEAMRPFLPRTQATRNRYLGYLRAVFRFGMAHGLTKNNPLANWKKPKEQPRRVSLTVTQLCRIMRHSPEHLRWAIEVEWNLGARPGPSELFALTRTQQTTVPNDTLIAYPGQPVWRFASSQAATASGASRPAISANLASRTSKQRCT